MGIGAAPAALALAFTATAVLVAYLRRRLLARSVIDIPNERSSHSTPTPRGGGVGFVAVITVAYAFAAALGVIAVRDAAGLLVSGLAVAGIGYLDDLRGVPARVRIIVHFAATALGLWLLQASPFAAGFDVGGVAAYAVTLVGLVWWLNLFNFMDGIDGIAASEAIFIAGAMALLAQELPQATSWPLLLGVFAAACCGFLVWNWSPARIFMGDAGSGFLGLMLGLIATKLALDGVLPIATSLILGAVFISDATVTLLRRITRGERWYDAHRSHVYQQLSRRWRSHARVVGVVWLVNLGVLLPLAWFSVRVPGVGPWIAAVVLFGLGVAALRMNAGCPDTDPPAQNPP